jgi:hypothetical protein
MPAPRLHDALQPLAALAGRWTGDGKGDYPTIEPFSYREECVFSHVGKPFFAYRQITWLDDGTPSHSEAGYLRVTESRHVELVVAHPFGVVEVSEGDLDAKGAVELRSRELVSATSAPWIDAVVRRLQVENDVFGYEVEMAAADQSLQLHLTATLRRAS